MVFEEEEEIKKTIGEAKRNCMLCMGRRHLRPSERERKDALNTVMQLRELFNEKFNELRRKDSSTALIQKSLENKRICMNAIDACNKCDKTVDNINRAMSKLV